LLKLSDSSEKPFRIGKSSHSRASIKWAINKATKLGVHVRAAETEKDLREWYMLYLDTMRRNIVPPRSLRFFATLRDLMQPRGMMQLLLAEQGRDGRRTILAGSIFLMFGRTLSYAFNGAKSEDLSMRPNDVIQWHAINEAQRRGFNYLDFGEVAEEHSQLGIFKSKWGSEPVRLYRYYYPAPLSLEGQPVKSRGYSALLAEGIWRRLPLKAIAWIGDRIYRYL
jgi:lipid II:glycine glycyltransferase (peptidoglycan interpeptide bridge formation enzyme)